MASAPTFSKFDPADHPGNVFDKFCEFIDAFGYEYEAFAKPPPTGTPNVGAWTEQDKRRQLLGRCASRNLQRDFEDEVPDADRSTITFKDTIKKLKERYKPTQNMTLANFEFKKLHQNTTETFDAFVNRVKHEAAFCDFACESDTCTVRDVMIRDQIVIGTSDDDIRRSALKEQWTLADLQSKGRKIEAATFGAAQIKKEAKREYADVNRTTPGKYSRKGGNGRKTQKQKCRNCSNKACLGGDRCFAQGRECFACGGKDHFKGSENCKQKKDHKSRKPKKSKDKTMRVKDNGSDNSSGSDSSSSDSESEVHRVAIHPARFVAHVRRSERKTRHPKKTSRYQVPVVIKEKKLLMFADTGADISILSKQTADDLNLPLTKTKMKIKPYGMKKRIKCVGYYVGPVRCGEEIANVGIYVVNGDVEPLLSGAASEALGVISFHGEKAEIRRSDATDPKNQVYMSKFPSIFTGVGKMKGVKVKYHIDPSVPPKACPKKPVPYHLQARLDKEIERLEQCGVIEDHEGPAPWISNLVLAPKDDGGLRVTVDMREPNKAILDTGLPIPRPEEIRAEFAGCKVFSKLDFKTAFHQLELEEESRYLTVFAHKDKLKRHTRLTMGAKPASGELNKVLRPLFTHLPAVHIIHDDLVIARNQNMSMKA